MTRVPVRILVVEDEPRLKMLLGASLSGEGYRTLEAGSGAEALVLARSHNPDLVLLALEAPGAGGVGVTRELRKLSTKPIIVVSACAREEDKIHALDAGADDYLTKPFGTGELMARIRVALRHASRSTEGCTDAVIQNGELEVDLDKRRVLSHGAEVHLTPNEYKLFAHLMKHAGKVLTHRQLLQEVWGAAYASQTHYLRVYMVQLRHKLEADPARPKYLHTEPGIGYRLETAG